MHLISKVISWASFNQIVCALRFFYDVTLDYDATPDRIAHAREPRKLHPRQSPTGSASRREQIPRQ